MLDRTDSSRETWRFRIEECSGSVIDVAPITQLHTCIHVLKIVTFKGGQLMW